MLLAMKTRNVVRASRSIYCHSFKVVYCKSKCSPFCIILSIETWTTLEVDVFRRWNLLYLCCVDIFTIFVLLFQICFLLSQRESFGRRYWLTLPSDHKAVYTEAPWSYRARSLLQYVLFWRVLIKLSSDSQAISTCLSWNESLLCVYGFFFVACLWSRCSLSVHPYRQLPQQARLMHWR